VVGVIAASADRKESDEGRDCRNDAGGERRALLPFFFRFDIIIAA
jgi:hypothetical protein